MSKIKDFVNPIIACIAIGCALSTLVMKLEYDRAWKFMEHGLPDNRKDGVWQRDDVTSSDPPGYEYWTFIPNPKSGK